MLGINHILLGAAIGEKIDNPSIAFLAGVASHFIVDKIPHFWPKENKQKGFIIIIDTILSLTCILLIIFLSHSAKKLSIIAGAIGGGSIDFYFVLMLRSKGGLALWHTDRQKHYPHLIWILTDIFLFLTSISLLWIFK